MNESLIQTADNIRLVRRLALIGVILYFTLKK